MPNPNDENILREFDKLVSSEAMKRHIQIEVRLVGQKGFDTIENQFKYFLRSALLQARKDERERVGREIVEALENRKLSSDEPYYRLLEDSLINSTLGSSQEIVSSITGLNEK